jgi:hypothetical protein
MEGRSRGVEELNIQLSRNRDAVATEHLAARVTGLGRYRCAGA